MLNDYDNPQQIGLMHSESAVTEDDKVFEAVGAVNVTKHNTQLHPDKRFCIFNKKFVNTELHNMYMDLSKHMNICRLRIMTMGPQFVYPTHKDVLTRYHMAIETNDDCVFLFSSERLAVHIPADGYLYFTDTRNRHTFVNSGKTTRIHLVLSTF
jgi:hypothetical protein